MEAAMNNLRKLDADTESLLSIVAPFVPMLTLLRSWHNDGTIEKWGASFFQECIVLCLLGVAMIIASMVISKKKARAKMLLSFLGHAAFWAPIFCLSFLETAWERSVGISATTAWPYIALIAAVGLFVFQSCLYIDMYRRSREAS